MADQELAAIVGLWPDNFDWVTARHACVPEEYFSRLKKAARENVANRNRLPGVEKFQIDDQGNSLFSVTRQDSPGLSVRFRLDKKQVVIEGTVSGGDPRFSGTPTLTDDGRCRLRVGKDGKEEELAEWQVLRKALELLFFPAVP